METYQLYTQGKLVHGKNLSEVFDQLRALKFPEALLKAIADGKQVRIKRAATWQQAKALQKRLLALGLKSTVQLEFTRNAFIGGLESITLQAPAVSSSAAIVIDKHADNTHASSTPVSPKASAAEVASTTQLNTKTYHWLFDKKQLLPSVVAMPSQSNMTERAGSFTAKLSSFNVHIKPFFLFTLTMIVGMAVQFYAIRLMTSYFHWHSMASILGVTIILVWGLCVPRLIQPRAMFSIRLNNTTSILRENPRFILGGKEYAVFDSGGELVGEIHRSHTAAHFFNIDGECIYSWDKKSKPAFNEDDAADVISDALLNDNLLGEIFDGFEYINKIKKLFIKPLPADQVEWKAEDSLVFVDINGLPVGRCFIEPYPAIEFKLREGNDSDAAQMVLFATALILPGVL